MHQATAGSSERRRQGIARWRRRRRLLERLSRPGAQEEFLPKEGEVVGGFTLEARLGAGSYGTVFRARRGESLYALKLLYLPHAGAWAWRELEVLLRLHHAGLVGVDSHGHHGHHPEVGPLFLYIVMDYVPGLPMGEYVERHNPVALWVARAVLALAAQLEVAHGVGVVHRDIKDDNVVVGEEGHAVLVDYGVGTFPGALKVSWGRLPNTPLFRAPEAWRFLRESRSEEDYEASARDDSWALGVLFYWLLTGTWPFYGREAAEVADAVLHTQPVPPHVRNPRVPQVLSAVCLRMLEKEPQARYSDARAVYAALETALEGAEASWEVPLCEAWAPDNATTRRETAPGDVAVAVNLERAVARGRRVSAYMREHPRRGGPAPTEPDAPEQSPGMDEPPVGEVEEPPARDTEREVAPAPVEPRARAASGYARAWRASMLALGVGAVLAAAYLHTVPAPSQVAAAPRVAPLPAQSATPVSWVAWVLSGQEVAPPWGPLEGGEGAAPAWAPTSAPVAFATLPEDSTRVKTSPKDSSPQQKKQGPVRNTVATAVCTATVGAVAAGCSGAQVRATPAPEACPAGSLEAMKQLGIHTGDETGAQFPGAEPGFVTVREGSGAQLVLGRPLGQLEAGTVLTGTLLFGKERVYGRFTEARRPGGATYSVCLEAWDVGWQDGGRGLVREPNGGPDTAKVTAGPHVQAVERFE